MENKSTSLIVIYLAFVLLFFVGEVKCIVKAVECNWAPVGKAEVIYTIGAVSGAGCIIGFLDIEDK